MKMLLITTIIFFAFIFNVSEMTNLQAFGDNLISQKYPSTMQLLIQSAPNQLNLIPPQDRQIHLKFFDATTTNPVGNVTFVMIVTKGNQIFLQNTFWSQSGIFTLHLKPGERYLWTANPDHDPMDGLYYSKGDQIDIETSYLTDNVYHFSIQPVSVNQNDLSQQKIGGKFGADLNLLSTYNETLAPDANITSSVNPLKISSPLKQFKSGVAANDVKCGQNLQLIIKSEDGSPACVKSDTAQKLIERGWAKITVTIANLDVVESNMTQTSKESIRIIPEYPISTGINKNGTMTDSETIEILFDNFKQTNSSLVIQILNPQGTIYRVDNIPHNDIQSDGFYKYQIYIKGNQSAMGQYKVIVTHDNATASISTYLSNVVP